MTPPARFKSIEDWSPEDFAAYKADGTKPETPEYRDAVRTALERDGLEVPDELAGPKDLEDMTPEDHANRRHHA